MNDNCNFLHDGETRAQLIVLACRHYCVNSYGIWSDPVREDGTMRCWTCLARYNITRSTSSTCRQRSELPTGGSPRLAPKPGLQRLQKLNEIRFLLRREVQTEPPVVVIDHGRKCGRATVVKVRRVLPRAA